MGGGDSLFSKTGGGEMSGGGGERERKREMSLFSKTGGGGGGGGKREMSLFSKTGGGGGGEMSLFSKTREREKCLCFLRWGGGGMSMPEQAGKERNLDVAVLCPRRGRRRKSETGRRPYGRRSGMKQQKFRECRR